MPSWFAMDEAEVKARRVRIGNRGRLWLGRERQSPRRRRKVVSPRPDCRLAKGQARINVACTPCDDAPTSTAPEPAPYYAAVFAMRAPAPPNTNLHFTRDPNGEQPRSLLGQRARVPTQAADFCVAESGARVRERLPIANVLIMARVFKKAYGSRWTTT